MKSVCLAVLAVLFFDLAFYAACGQAKTIEFKYVSVAYADEEQLAVFLEKIKPNVVTQMVSRIFLGQGRAGAESLGQLLDLLFKRVQVILDMPLPNLKVKLLIHASQEELFKVFSEVSGGPNKVQAQLGVNESLPSFYERPANTIHLQVERYNIGILAHEMAHCVTSNFFVIPPPTRVSELMSQYVDKIITTEGLE
ncbi:MAG: hypothetical protein V1816_19155 [Pseudomonadota bacterium]